MRIASRQRVGWEGTMPQGESGGIRRNLEGAWQNELPALLTEEMVEHAFGEWKLGRQHKKTWKRKRDEDSLP